MKIFNVMMSLIGATCLIFGASGCDSGFGEPCEVPKTSKFEKACGTVANRAPSNDDAVRMTSRASCAIKNFAGCSTRVCMVYRGSTPYCTTNCASSADCEGSAVCRPLVGEAVTEEDVIRECDPSGAFATECYCVREGDAVSGAGVAAAAPPMSSMPTPATPAAPGPMTNMTNPMVPPQQPPGGGAAPQMALPAAAGPMGGMAP